MDIFVYGTLMSEPLFCAVAGGKPCVTEAAKLDGYVRFGVAGDVVPFIAPASDQHVGGVIYREVDAAQAARLDLYERAFGYVTETVLVMTTGGHTPVTCYMPPDGISANKLAWSLACWEADHLAPALLAAAEVFSHDPLPTPDTLRRMWPMIESRAWAKHRTLPTPATLRHDPQSDDITVLAKRPPQGGFFRMQDIDVHHKRFDGSRSDPMRREIFIAVDAAFVLPYDPVRDKVILVEQVRMGPLMRNDPNPWMLEPVAGIVDARETPEQAAHREAFEEAAVTLDHLEPISAFYASPGSTTDYFYTYIGLCDLPQTTSYLGGLAEEGEDIRLHPMTFDAALALADSGEIQVGPLVLMLNWLARHHDRLRAMA
ncbi:tellurium resistance protein [Loktanella sp. D2R18]|uniref:gamma-glutamylcyclotransferase n=1 Tax=Rhodobacterales TaxID=204455 RepID=UPI000DEA01FD|nr:MULTISPECIES: gamma-glutamylcyclotransferase [Rhodobacterales]MDO6590766.1 gamma-glutamylcyclotransferase [Yoonia sp. 1_MG-2023]RBW44618.1 tellurium resistance protein [Loktanella sp. D2R18]